jgi:hypothetical protein
VSDAGTALRDGARQKFPRRLAVRLRPGLAAAVACWVELRQATQPCKSTYCTQVLRSVAGPGRAGSTSEAAVECDLPCAMTPVDLRDLASEGDVDTETAPLSLDTSPTPAQETRTQRSRNATR